MCDGKVRLIQKKKGYRLSIDPFLLANFVTLKRREILLDIGTGCGIIPVYLSRKGIENRIVGIEIQEELYDLALRNKELNGCANVDLREGRRKNSGEKPRHVSRDRVEPALRESTDREEKSGAVPPARSPRVGPRPSLAACCRLNAACDPRQALRRSIRPAGWPSCCTRRSPWAWSRRDSGRSIQGRASRPCFLSSSA